MVSKAREIFVLATERDATTRRRAAFILFSFLTSAGVRENRCGVFEEIVEKKSRQVRVDRNRPNARDRLDRVGEPVISTAALSFSLFPVNARASLFFRFRRLRDRLEMFLRDASSRTYARYFTSALRFRTRETRPNLRRDSGKRSYGESVYEKSEEAMTSVKSPSRWRERPVSTTCSFVTFRWGARLVTKGDAGARRTRHSRLSSA